MQLPVIKKLITEPLDVLKLAEQALMEGKKPPITIEGKDEGDQLTNLLGAIAVKEEMMRGVSERDALRAFAQRVRDVIQ
ncbi:MAG: DUF6952 family protein [Sphingobacteriia bacterium]|jgi:hypothetical protein